MIHQVAKKSIINPKKTLYLHLDQSQIKILTKTKQN